MQESMQPDRQFPDAVDRRHFLAQTAARPLLGQLMANIDILSLLKEPKPSTPLSITKYWAKETIKLFEAFDPALEGIPPAEWGQVATSDKTGLKKFMSDVFWTETFSRIPDLPISKIFAEEVRQGGLFASMSGAEHASNIAFLNEYYGDEEWNFLYHAAILEKLTACRPLITFEQYSEENARRFLEYIGQKDCPIYQEAKEKAAFILFKELRHHKAEAACAKRSQERLRLRQEERDQIHGIIARLLQSVIEKKEREERCTLIDDGNRNGS